jgi:acyl-CoA thioesterase
MADAEPSEAQSLAEAVRVFLTEADARVNRLLGIAPTGIAPGRASCSLTVKEHHLNSHRVCHGGILFALADAAIAYATCSSNRSCLTLSANMSFLRPAELGDVLTATAEVQADGRRASTAAARVTDQDGRLIALAQGTCLRLEEPVLPAMQQASR